MKVKVVDFKGPNAAHDFATSLRESGFAVVGNHSIPLQVIEGAFAEWQDFFAASLKHEYLFNSETQAGYFPFRSENAKGYSQKDLKEFFHYYPAKSMLPESVRRFTPDLYVRLNEMATTLLGWLDEFTPRELREKLSMPFAQMIRDSQETLLRPIHYPPITGEEEEGAVRAAAHEDINLITLLTAASAPGLQVKDLEGKWWDVPCDRGTIVVNAGDMLAEATSGYYPSTTHRVVNPRGAAAFEPRYSMPLFLHPRADVKLSPRHTAWSYLQERLMEIGLVRK